MNSKLVSAAIALCMGGTITAAADSFVTTSGMKILDRNGQEITLRGTNCGNWMVQEPYMMNTSGNLDRQYKFHNMLVEICGEAKAEEFDRIWMDNVFGEADMKFIAQQKFNTLRVPMHYKYFTLPIEKEPVAGQQTWLTEGFDRIDQLIEWANKYNILLILDMHACPGGQSSGDICDYDSSKPSLWESDANRKKLVALWRKIAERYADEKCIAAYDLINETNWSLPNSNKALWDLFKDIIAAVREVDKNHIVIVEGNGYSNDYTGFPAQSLDPKMVIQYHRYGVYNTTEQMQGMYNNGKSHNCPIYVGEFGENSNSWDADGIRVMEEVHGFGGWSQWPLKKSNMNTILRVSRVAAYDNVISRWQNGQKPTSEELWKGVTAWAEAQAFKNCSVGTDFVDAMMRRPHDRTTKPFFYRSTADHIFFAQYDMGPCGIAYWDTDDASYQYNGEDFTNWQNGWIYRNDGVDIEAISSSEPIKCGYNVGWTADGEWMQYTVNNPQEGGIWKMDIRYALQSGSSRVRVTVNGVEVVPATTLNATGDYQTWQTKTIDNVLLPKGTCTVRVYMDKGGANLNWFYFHDRSEASDEQLAVFTPAWTENMLRGGDCPKNGPDFWYIAAVGSINSMKVSWITPTNKPSKGSGDAVVVSSTRSGTSNICLYQPVKVYAGHRYKVDLAYRGISGNGDFWVQAFMTTNQPVDYADIYLEEGNTIGQLNSWQDSSLATFDGLMSEKATEGSNHKEPAMQWTAPADGVVYFALKIGSQKHPFTATLDNFSVIDLDGADVEPVAAASLPYELDGRNLRVAADTRIYNLQGIPQQPGLMTPGLYLISSPTSSHKLLIP